MYNSINNTTANAYSSYQCPRCKALNIQGKCTVCGASIKKDTEVGYEFATLHQHGYNRLVHVFAAIAMFIILNISSLS